MGPTEIFLTGGVAAVLAAAIGGGLKAFGVEIPLLAKPRQQAFGLIVGICLIILGLANDGWFSSLRNAPDTKVAQVNAAGADEPAMTRPQTPGGAVIPAATRAAGTSPTGLPSGPALLEAVINDDLEGVRRNLNATTFTARGTEGMTALMIAANNCRVGIAVFILQSGRISRAAINARNEFGDTALRIAAGTDSELRDRGMNVARCPQLVPLLQPYAQ
jgi:hypothetical protein